MKQEDYKVILGVTHISDCKGCKDCGGKYECHGCGKQVGWCNGGDDDMPNHCTECWEKAHELTTQLAP